MNQEKPLSRESMIAIIIFAVLLGLTLLPGLSLAAVWFLPLPLIVLTALESKWIPLALSVIAAAALLLGGFGWTAALFALGSYAIGRAMGDTISSYESPHLPLIFGTLIYLMLELILLALVRWSGFNVFAAFDHIMRLSVQQDQSFLHLSSSEASQVLRAMGDWVRLMLPGVLAIMAFLLSTVNLLLARFILAAHKAEWKPLLLNWNLPYSVVLCYVCALAVILFGWLKSNEFWWQIANNTSLIAGFFIGVQGLSYLWRRVYKRRFKYLWLTLLVLLPTASRLIGNVFIMIGLLDLMNRTRRV